MKLYNGCERDLVIAVATANKSTRWQLVLVNEQIVAVLDLKGDGVGLAGSLLLLPVVAASMTEVWPEMCEAGSGGVAAAVLNGTLVVYEIARLTHLLGAAAKNQHAANPRRTVFDIKRLIGRKLSVRRRPELLANKFYAYSYWCREGPPICILCCCHIFSIE
ncbi:hypothetical protein MKW98_016491 [Papaver atlanticum]|uniref:Uncharacterized protein n=1 Tax=Papaver atlanticum TaxID=357466 RepID=A0AAD4XSK0_9MAGN|nr:hypothetical protein MKW98_016491 [Papaver atlanticum]